MGALCDWSVSFLGVLHLQWHYSRRNSVHWSSKRFLEWHACYNLVIWPPMNVHISIAVDTLRILHARIVAMHTTVIAYSRLWLITVWCPCAVPGLKICALACSLLRLDSLLNKISEALNRNMPLLGAVCWLVSHKPWEYVLVSIESTLSVGYIIRGARLLVELRQTVCSLLERVFQSD